MILTCPLPKHAMDSDLSGALQYPCSLRSSEDLKQCGIKTREEYDSFDGGVKFDVPGLFSWDS